MGESSRSQHGLVVAIDVPADDAARLVADLVELPTVIDVATDPLDGLDHKWAESVWDTVVAVCRDVGSLRRAAAIFDSLGTATTVVVHLVEHQLPLPASHRGVALPTSAQATTTGFDRGIRLTVAAEEPQRPRLVVNTVALPGVLSRASGLRVSAADHEALPWCVDEPDAQTLAVTRRIGGSAEIAPDVVVATAALTPDDVAARATVDVSRRCPPVDTRVVNPRGFPTEFAGQARIEKVGDGVVLRLTDNGSLMGDPSGRLAASDLPVLQSLRHVRLENAAERHLPAVPLATLLAHLAAAGVPTITHSLPPEVAALLHPDLVEALETARPMETAEPLTREGVSVRQRRAALRRHNPSASWDRLRSDLGLAAGLSTMTSVLLVTRRPYFLGHALHSIATQQNADMEVVLVTHGFTLDKGELRRWREQCGHPITVLTADDGLPLGAALNRAVDAAAGDAVTKMDDDDWYGPHHVEDVSQALTWSGATVVGVQALYTYLVDLDITVHGPDSGIRETAGRRAPGPTMTFRKSDLLHLGGFRPLPRYEDLSISLALKRMGGSVHLTHGLGFLRCRHGAGHSWAAGTAHFLRGTSDQWRGFRPPPEVTDDDEARQHLDDVRRRSGDSAPVRTR